MQSIFALTRYFGGPETFAWMLQWIMSVTVAVSAALLPMGAAARSNTR